MKGSIVVIRHQATRVLLENLVLFTKCGARIDGSTIDDTEDLDLVMPMNNLIEYSSGTVEL